MSQAAGWLKKQLVASGPPALSRAVAHIIMSSFCPQETQQASGSLETPESKGQALAVRVCRCFCGEGFFVSFIELQLLCRFIFFMYPLLISGSLSCFFPMAKIPHLPSKPKQLESDVSVGVLTDQSVELKQQQHRNGVDKLSNVFG